MEQEFSIFHGIEAAKMSDWHSPYAGLFRGCNWVVDLGCGTGTFLNLLRESGVRGVGLEIDPKLVAQLNLAGLSAYHATHKDIREYAVGCDGIHVSHLLEHLWGEEMIALLEGCRDCLLPGGLLVIRTPNWTNKNVSGGGFWDDYTHTRPYSLRQLEKILTDMGMIVTASGYEPFGWEDTYLVARKKPFSLSASLSDRPVWPSSRVVSANKPSLGIRIKRRLRRWLLED
jgi:O-antigen chain-terminating methyltransferase